VGETNNRGLHRSAFANPASKGVSELRTLTDVEVFRQVGKGILDHNTLVV